MYMTLYKEFKKALKLYTYEQICDAIVQYQKLIKQECGGILPHYNKCLKYCYKEKYKRDKKSRRKLGR